MRRTIVSAIVGTGIAMVVTIIPAQAALTLGDLITSPNNTITVGDKIFGDFKFQTACPLTASQIAVSTVQYNQWHYALVFTGPLMASDGMACDFMLGYSVSVAPGFSQYPIKSISLSFVPTVLGSGGLIGIGESVYTGGFGIGGIAQASVGLTDFEDPPGEPAQMDVLNVTPPATKLWVLKDVYVQANQGVGNAVGATIITQDFQEVPEPAQTATAVLLLTGLGTMLLKRKSR